jgi:uncharacterized membrane protein
MGLLPRAIFTIFIIGAFALINIDTNAVGTIALGNFAGMQFNNSDTDAVVSQAGIHHISLLIIFLDLALVGSIIGLWWSYIKEIFQNV